MVFAYVDATELLDFGQWLKEFMAGEASKAHYLTILQRLQVEEDKEIRGNLRREADQLENAIKF